MIDKKILILGSNESFSIERMYERAFKKLGLKECMRELLRNYALK